VARHPRLLHSVDLRGSRVNDAALANLTGLSGLRRLILDKTQVSDVGIGTLYLRLADAAAMARVPQALPRCTIR